jgi:hypothetical protein
VAARIRSGPYARSSFATHGGAHVVAHMWRGVSQRWPTALPPARAMPAPVPLAGSPLSLLHNTCEMLEIKETKNSEETRF